MFKKIASIALAATMLVGTAAIAANAAEVEDDAVVAADASSEVGADASSEAGADASDSTSASSNVIKFDVSTTDWNMDSGKRCMAYIYEIGQSAFFDWGTKSTRMTAEDSSNKSGVWYYDLDKAGITIESGKYYAVIFSNEAGVQTADLLFDSSCVGDTAIVKDTSARLENTADSNKSSYVAYWTSGKYGPLKAVTSIGNIVGDVIAPNTSAYAMFVDFLKNTLTNALEYSGKDEQTLIDDTAKALGLGQDLIADAIKEAGVSVSWTASSSSASETSDSTAKSNGGGTSSSSSGSSSSGSSSGSSSSGSSSSSSSSSSGSSSVASGQETTIFIVLGGVMLAAAGVVFLSRKRKMN